MKKHNLCRVGLVLFAIVALVAIGCKSTPPEQNSFVQEAAPPPPEPEEVLLDVNPLDLLAKDSTFYISLPPNVDPDLTQRIVQKYFSGAAGQANQIMSRVSTVYAGFYNSRHSSYVQIAADGRIPKNLAKLAFTQKNGWDENTVITLTDIPSAVDASTLITKETEYKSYVNPSAFDMQIALPSTKIACIAPDVTNMLIRYDALARGVEQVPGGPELPNDVAEWLTDPPKEIRFYAGNPLSFLTILMGANLNLQLKFVKAVMVPDEKSNERYLLDLEFEFLNERVVSAGQGLLNLAFGLTNSKVVRNSPTNLSISEMEIKKEQLYRLLSL